VKDEVKALARHRMARAHEAFTEGDYLFTKGSMTGAVNRFYYAGFYASRALLATQGVDFSRHSGVISLFQKHFVKTNQVSRAHARALPRSKSVRIRIMPTLPRLLQKKPKAFGPTSAPSWMNVQSYLSACWHLNSVVISRGIAGLAKRTGQTNPK
jgi:uncharacterized protein (UPF0332 family)